MMTEKERIEEAKEEFRKRNHKATLLQNTDRYTIIDWRNGNGSGEYYVNYIIDKKRGSLIISGDLGDCIATWYNKCSVHDITYYIRSVDYFVGKFQCTSDDYVYDEDEIIEEVKNQLEDIGIEHTEEFEEEFEDFKYELSDCVNKDGFFPNMVTTVSEFLDKYLGDYWWESSNTWGRSISKKVYLWVAGLNMAVEQLDKEGILTKED